MFNIKVSALKAGLMDNLISDFHKLPLKYISLRKVAIMFCSHARVLQLVVKCHLIPEYSLSGIDDEVESMARDILPEIFLPKTMHEEMICLLKPLCREVFKWFYFHAHFFNSECVVDIPQHLCWTPLGTIDYRKTARALTYYEKLEISKRYRIACQYCLYRRIQNLWEQLPQKFIEEMLSPYNKGSLEHYDIRKAELDVFWAYTLEGRVDDLKKLLIPLPRYSSIYQCAFESVAVQGYKSATCCFFKKLTPAEREISLERTANEVVRKRSFDSVNYKQEYQKFSDVLFYLFSVMDKKQLKVMLFLYPFEILKCCLDWPRQSIFVDVAKQVIRHLNREEYSRLLFILSKNVMSGYHYSDIFQKFLMISPENSKNYSLNHYGLFLKNFFFAEDIETVKFIFRSLDSAEKKTLAFTISSRICCFQLFLLKRYDFLKLFFREARLLQFEIPIFAKAVAQCCSEAANDYANEFVAYLCNKEESTSNQISSECDKVKQADLPSSEENPEKKLKVS